jgi:D-cysteine desulfhydrase
VIDRRAFLLGAGAMLGCSRRVEAPPDAAPVVVPPPLPPPRGPTSVYALFDAFPALGKSIARIELAQFPSPIERAKKLLGDRLYVKRDDDFTRSPSFQAGFEAARTFGGGKVRKLELFFGEARALGKREIVTFGGVGSNQALAAALLGRMLGFAVKLYLAPQPPSVLTTKNLAGDAASGAEMRLFPSVVLAQAAAAGSDAYLIPPGGTTPLGTIGFVNAGLELAADVRAGKMPAPKRVYVALGLGGTAVGLAIGCELGGLATEIVAVRASNPTTVSDATLRSIHDDTLAFMRARDASIPKVEARVRIEGGFVGDGYGVPTRAGDDAVERARAAEGWSLDPVYTGKALAALLADAAAGPTLFWNTQSSRPVPEAPVPAAFARFMR